MGAPSIAANARKARSARSTSTSAGNHCRAGGEGNGGREGGRAGWQSRALEGSGTLFNACCSVRGAALAFGYCSKRRRSRMRESVITRGIMRVGAPERCQSASRRGPMERISLGREARRRDATRRDAHGLSLSVVSERERACSSSVCTLLVSSLSLSLSLSLSEYSSFCLDKQEFTILAKRRRGCRAAAAM